MPDMQGKTVVVTGGNSGIGFETAAALARMGARVLVTARNADKGRAAVAAITQRLDGDGQVQLVVFDLADLASVRQGAAEILEQAPRLDVLVNNAGLVLTERAETVDGYEATFATNHLGPVPPDQPAARPDHGVGAVPHRQRGVDGPQRGPQGDPLRRPAVRRSATGACGCTGSRSWPTSCSRWSWPGASRAAGVTANSLHPGTVRTGYGGDGDARGLARLRDQDRQSLLPLAGQGRPHLGVPGFVPRGGGRQRGVLRQVQAEAARRWAQDPEAARRLWQVSEELVGLAPAGTA